jgi:hypothetical protein
MDHSLCHGVDTIRAKLPDKPLERESLRSRSLGVVLKLPPLDALHDIDKMPVTPEILVASPADLLKRVSIIPLVSIPVRDPKRSGLPLRFPRGLFEKRPSIDPQSIIQSKP